MSCTSCLDGLARTPSFRVRIALRTIVMPGLVDRGFELGHGHVAGDREQRVVVASHRGGHLLDQDRRLGTGAQDRQAPEPEADQNAAPRPRLTEVARPAGLL